MLIFKENDTKVLAFKSSKFNTSKWRLKYRLGEEDCQSSAIYEKIVKLTGGHFKIERKIDGSIHFFEI